MPSCADSTVPMAGTHRVSIAALRTDSGRPGHWMVWARRGYWEPAGRPLWNTAWLQKEGDESSHIRKANQETPSSPCLEVCLYGDSKSAVLMVRTVHHTQDAHGE